MFKAAGDCCHGILWRAILVLLYRAQLVFSDSFFYGLSIGFERVIL